MSPIDPTLEHAALNDVLDAYAVLRERMGPRLFAPVVRVSKWSAAQHLYHAALATDLALRNVRALALGKGRMIIDEGEPNELAVLVLTQGSYPRGESEAPRMVQPPNDVDAEFLTDEMKRNREDVEGLRGLLDDVPGAAGRIRHHALGELSAGEWLRFARLHADHHLAIARDVETAGAG